MSRIDFAFGAPDRLRMACEVVRKHYEAGRHVVVYSTDGPRLARFDRLLWGFEPTAFVPHVMADDPLASQARVVLCKSEPWQATRLALGALPDEKSGPVEENKPASWLVNLDSNCPPEAEHFERILEIVSGNEQDKSEARERWRQYQAAGHTLRAHDVSPR
jgi:DNA polymerase-3 subunit chi